MMSTAVAMQVPEAVLRPAPAAMAVVGQRRLVLPVDADMEAEVDMVVVAAEREAEEGVKEFGERKPESMLPRHACCDLWGLPLTARLLLPRRATRLSCSPWN